jgi:hypothetical protein
MKGDFTRFTFDPRNHYVRVLMQQGRVQLDADWNEQAGILLHYLQTLARDLIGDHGGPLLGELGFGITLDGDGTFTISPGHYYVDGILCENDEKMDAEGAPIAVTYTSQPDYPAPPPLPDTPPYLVYLDVWERHVTYIQDDHIREVALGGPDTATRAKVVWQVKATDKTGDGDGTLIKDAHEAGTPWRDWVQADWDKWVGSWQPKHRGWLKAKSKEDPKEDTDPCITPPDARYRGAENQLYRVEIHRKGSAWDGTVDENGNPAGNAQTAATCKWSRDDGSVVFPILKLADSDGTTTVELAHLGRDNDASLQPGDWVEIVDDEYDLKHRAEPLLKVISVDRVDMRVTLEGKPSSPVGQNPAQHPLLRRWDHRAGAAEIGGLQLHEGAALIRESSDAVDWLVLEDGVQVQFQTPKSGAPENTYRSGDYWLIPARTATGDVEWPKEKDKEGKDQPAALTPHGVQHHYAPIAIVDPSEPNGVADLRRKFNLVWDDS